MGTGMATSYSYSKSVMGDAITTFAYSRTSIADLEMEMAIAMEMVMVMSLGDSGFRK